MNGEHYTLLKNVRLIDPEEKRTDGVDIYYCKKGGQSTVLQVGKGLKPTEKEGLSVINTHGAIACPAFTDLRCALPYQDSAVEETLYTFLLSASVGGYARVLASPFRYLPDSPARCESLLKNADKAGDCRLLPAVALTKGCEGSVLAPFEAMKEKGAFAITADCERQEPSGKLLLAALEESERLKMPFIAPCREKSLQGNGVNKGAVAQKLREEGEDPASELLALSKALMLAHTRNIPVHFPLVTLKESVRLIGEAKRAGVPITCATAPPYFSFTESELIFTGENARLSPPLRREADRMAVIEGLQSGVIDCICSDHTPLPSSGTKGKKQITGASGFETVFAAGMTHLVIPGHLSLYRLLYLLSLAPADLLGIDCRIKPGNPMDLAFINTESEMFYNRHSMRTRGLNTPFYGKALRGRVTGLYINGVRQQS